MHESIEPEFISYSRSGTIARTAGDIQYRWTGIARIMPVCGMQYKNPSP